MAYNVISCIEVVEITQACTLDSTTSETVSYTNIRVLSIHANNALSVICMYVCAIIVQKMIALFIEGLVL